LLLLKSIAKMQYHGFYDKSDTLR